VPETEEPVGIVNPDSPQPSHVQNFNFPFMAVSYETSPMLNTVNCCILGSFLDSFYLATSRFLSCWENYTTSLSKQICDTIIQLDKKTPCLEKFYQGPSKKKKKKSKVSYAGLLEVADDELRMSSFQQFETTTFFVFISSIVFFNILSVPLNCIFLKYTFRIVKWYFLKCT
jgi:hypothetical protein